MADLSRSRPSDADDHAIDEATLVEGLRRRDPDTVAAFLQRTHRNVYAMSCRLTTDAELRQDWTHDVLLVVLEELARGRFEYRWPGCFWSWFGKRSRFLLLDAARRRRIDLGRQVESREGEDLIDGLRASDVSDPERLLADVELRAAIEECVARIPSEDQRRALVLALFEELSYEDVARAMDAPLNTVRSWIRRARTAARRCLSAFLDLQSQEP